MRALHRDYRELERIDLSTAIRATIVKLLIAEMDKLAHDLEQSEYSEELRSVGAGKFRELRNSLVDGSTTPKPDRLLALAEETRQLMETRLTLTIPHHRQHFLDLSREACIWC